jgi:hypothetical protein
MRTIFPGPSFAIATASSAFLGLALLLAAPSVRAGVQYQVTAREVMPHPQGPIVQQYYVNGEEVRAGALDAKSVRLFKDGTLYILTPATRSVQVLKDFTLEQAQKRMDATAAKMESYAATASPDRRETAQGAASMIEQIAKRQREVRPPEFKLTDRSETVGGYPCRIWEASTGGANLLELCVAPTTAIPGGAEILKGMQSMLSYVYGSDVALGVEFGPVDVWPAVKALNGVPILVRQFSAGQLATELELTNMHAATLSDSLFQVPPGYTVQSFPTGIR